MLLAEGGASGEAEIGRDEGSAVRNRVGEDLAVFPPLKADLPHVLGTDLQAAELGGEDAGEVLVDEEVSHRG
ncbi:MAG TPA: hypothetical protein VGC93_07710 [Thermoanaerobaculia bacterium]